MYAIGVTATLLALVGLELLSHFFKSLGMRNLILEFNTGNRDIISDVSAFFNDRNYIVVSYEMKEVPLSTGEVLYRVSMVIKAKKMNEEGLLLLMMHKFPGVTVTKII